jgi:hypothetical protein
VAAVARRRSALAELAATSASIRIKVANAADAMVAWSLLDEYKPEVLILTEAKVVQEYGLELAWRMDHPSAPDALEVIGAQE